MSRKSDKPTPEAKALSLFLMAYKSKDPKFKEKLKKINRLWDLVGMRKLGKVEYQKEVQTMLDEYGGYDKVVENTVNFYIKKSGEWTLKGDDKYCRDAKVYADTLLAK